MSLKSIKLEKRIQAVQQYVFDKINQGEIYVSISQELSAITESLAKEKLEVNIISAKSNPAQALQNFLKSSQTLTDSCLFQIASLPTKIENTKLKYTAVLIPQEYPENPSESKILSPHQKVIIGRNPHLCNVLVSDDRTMVSGHHAEIKLITNSTDVNTDSNWQFCDVSRYGSYINSQKIYQKCRILQKGDRITLGEVKLTDKSAEFIFEYKIEEQSEEGSFDRQLINCDILCLILNPNQIITDDEKWILEKATQAKIEKIVIIIEIPQADNKLVKQTEAKASEVENYIRSQYPTLPFEIISLILQPFYPEIEVAEIESNFQKQPDKFTKSLETLVKRHPEDTLAQRLDTQVGYQLTQIIKLLENQINNLKLRIDQAESQIQRLDKAALKEQMKKVFKRVSEDRDLFFKQVKDELNKSKNDLLDPLSNNSISAKIQRFTEYLKPSVTNQHGFCYVQLQRDFEQLQPDSYDNYDPDIHRCLVSLIQDELTFWALEEWEHIHGFYGGGFQKLLQKNSEIINAIPSLNLSNSYFQPLQKFEVQPISPDSVTSILVGDKYKQPSLPVYMLKNIKMMIFTFVSIAMLFITGTLPKDWLPGNTKLLIMLAVTGVSAPVLYCNYHHEKEIKIEEKKEKLQQDVTRHYQPVAKNLADKRLQSIVSILEASERQIIKSLEIIEEQFTIHLANLEKTQLEIKARTAQYSQQRRSLEAELQKLKRL